MPQIFQLSAVLHFLLALQAALFLRYCTLLSADVTQYTMPAAAGRVDNSFVCKSQQSTRQRQTTATSTAEKTKVKKKNCVKPSWPHNERHVPKKKNIIDFYFYKYFVFAAAKWEFLHFLANTLSIFNAGENCNWIILIGSLTDWRTDWHSDSLANWQLQQLSNVCSSFCCSCSCSFC